MKKMILLAALALAAATPSVATAQRGMSMSRPSISMSTMRAPTIAPRPYVAPARTVTVTPRPYVAPPRPSVVQQAPVTRPVPTYRQAPQPKVAIRPATPATPATARAAVPPHGTRAAGQVPATAQRARPTHTVYRSHAWTAPSMMPYWWMASMHRPYSYASYDDFIRRCLDTPRRDRSDECVRALRERGIDG